MKIVSKVTDAVGLTDSKAGERAAQASQQAAQVQSGFQQQALDYLEQVQAPITEAQTGSLGRLSTMAEQGVNPYQLKSQSELVEGINQSPLYQALMGGLQTGEESILRNQAMTGGFRSGGTQQNLARLGRDTANQAFLSAYGDKQQRDMQQSGLNQQAFQNQLGLESTIMGQPTQIGNIAGLTSGIGQTLAQGQLGAAQNRLQGSQANTQNLLNLGSLAFKAFSDRRLKDNIQKVGTENGYNVYTWQWNDLAKSLGLEGSGKGVIADEVKQVKPEAVKRHQGFDTVDYEMIGVKHG